MFKSIFFICCLFCIQKDTPVLSWNEDKILDWSNYIGKPSFLSDAAAITASGITFGYSIEETNNKVVDIDLEIAAHFYPEESWYKEKHANAHLLNHERLHFDITEWYARKFKKRVKYLKYDSNVQRQLNRIYRKINKELDSTQRVYDKETDFSRDIPSQKKWEGYVTDEIEKLKDYKSN